MPIKIKLRPAEASLLLKQDPSTKGNGGYQSLLVQLQYKLSRPSNTIEIDARLRDRIRRYAFRYKNGGWQNRLLGIFSRTLGPNL